MTEAEKEAAYGRLVTKISDKVRPNQQFEIRTKDEVNFHCTCKTWDAPCQPGTCRHIKYLDRLARELLEEDPLAEAIYKSFQEHIPGCAPDRKLIQRIAENVRPLLGQSPKRIEPLDDDLKPERMIYVED